MKSALNAAQGLPGPEAMLVGEVLVPEEQGERYALWREYSVVEVDGKPLQAGGPADVGICWVGTRRI